ncbi:hypothetical protein HXX76_008251 [Chlamydomonas incerta]|uniref:Wax synthase domain-containing protein n=1 Tax=Chlamydomonas incerta TaxID=51695 RepID=A0A835SVL4_CHLIN|nr:hypothetical protein HXX76_008251 [Chlamydomonas incerta]|eukprot:KAG2433898.1 hypothetical protein HXX76_008251 [Chlamydomonas incerta]
MVLSQSRAGWPRFVPALPALAALAVAALLFDPYTEPLSAMTCAFMTLRMPATKLLAACYGRGPLAELPAAERPQPPAPRGQGGRKAAADGSQGTAGVGANVPSWLSWALRRTTAGDGACTGAEPAAAGKCCKGGSRPDSPGSNGCSGSGGGGDAGGNGRTPLCNDAATKWLELATAATALAAVSALDAWVSSSSYISSSQPVNPSPRSQQRAPPLLLHLLLPVAALPHHLSVLRSCTATASRAVLLLLRRLARGGAALCLHAVLATAMAAGVGGVMDCMAAYCYCRGWSGGGGGRCGSSRQSTQRGLQQQRDKEPRGSADEEEQEEEQEQQGDEGVELVRPFDSPLAATSLADFWGRRWNVTQSRVLKGLLYDPLVEGRWRPTHMATPPPPPPPPVSAPPQQQAAGSSSATGSSAAEPHTAPPPPDGASLLPDQHQHQHHQHHQHQHHQRHHQVRKAAALLAVFVWSGLEHELFHWLSTRRLSPGGGWFLFFAVHGVLLVAESAVTRAARRCACASASGTPSAPAKSIPSGGAVSRLGRAAAAAAAAAVAWALTPPVWMRRLLTLVVLDVTAAAWFFPALTERCVVRRVAAAVAGMCPPALEQRLLRAAAELGRRH